jgi:NO-binding membrane sensor protein with MHYT domain
MSGETSKKHVLFGAICCGVGIAANAMTYSGSASTQELTYVIAWGAIIFGTIQIVRGAVTTGPSNQP